MTVRREKAKKQQRPQLNKQLESTNEQPTIIRGRWKVKLGNYLLDVSKYVLTGVIITSLFKDMKDLVLLYTLGMAIVLLTLIAGLILTNKERKEK